MMSRRLLPLLLSAILSTICLPAFGLNEEVVLPSSEFANGSTQQAGIEGQILSQTSNRGFDLNGMRGGAYSRWKASETFSGGARVGREAFWKGKTSKDGFYSGAFGQYALNSQVVSRAELYYHDSMHDFWVGGISLAVQKELKLWTFAFNRELVSDSYTSLLGTEIVDPSGVGSTWLGAARRSVLSGSMKQTWEKSELDIKVTAGFVAARGVKQNQISIFDMYYKSGFKFSRWAFVSRTQLMGYQRDDGAIGGYFSPTMFFSQGLFMNYSRALSDKNSASLEFGPAYQSIQGTATKKGGHTGGQASFSLSRQLDEKFQLQIQGEYFRMANLWSTAQGMVYLHRVF